MTSLPSRIPLRPDYSARGKPSDSIVRAILASARSAYGGDATSIASRLWPEDRSVQFMIANRSATAPATITTPGWAAELSSTAVADLITTLGPASAASELLKRATMLTFGSNVSASIIVPTITVAAGDTPFVAEGAPIPIRQLIIGGGATLTPRKFACGFMVTNQLLQYSTPNAEKLVRAALTEAVAVALDSALLDATAASATRPAGLRSGVAAITATAGGTTEAMVKDLSALAAAVAPIGGMQLAFVASPGEAVKIALRAGPEFVRFPVLASGGLAAGVVVCIALPALVAAVSPEPNFSATKDATVHAEDTTPAHIGTVGSPNVTAAPSRSLFQTDVVAIKLILRMSWGLRVAAGGVSHVAGVTW